jgi:signal-transduction protein with cAMP-binding, CBS, and nucleotidyltransferase domain
MQTVKAIIESKSRAHNFVDPETLVIHALTQLNTVNLSYLVVMKGDKYKGIFCERDYSRNVILKGRSSSNTTVKEVMTTDLPVVDISDTVEYCMNLMNTMKTRYLLAYDEEKFQGVITIHDLLRQVIANKEKVFDHLAERLIDQDEGERIF